MERPKNFEDLIAELDSPSEVREETKPLEATPKGVQTLAEAFETTMSSLAPSPIEMQIVEGAVSNKSLDQIAITVGVPVAYIRSYLRKKEVQQYLKEIREAVTAIHQSKIQDTLSRMLDARIDKMEEGDEGYEGLSKKDTLDILKTFADISNAIAKNQTADKESDVFVQIYNQVMTK